MTRIFLILLMILGFGSIPARNSQMPEDMTTSLESLQQTSAEIVREPEMADLFRSEGKIYVVIAVLAITFLCLIGYLIYIDIRLRKLEKKK